MKKLEETSMAAVFQNRAREHGDKACVAYRNDAGQWFDVSWNRMNEMVHNLAYYLMGKGIQHGDKVAVFSPNRYEWWVADLAILSIGAVNIPIYATNTAEEVRYILDNADSRICFAGTHAHMEKVVAVRDRLPMLMEIVLFNDLEQPVDGVVTLPEAIRQGGAQADAALFDRRLAAIKPEDLCTFIYTSGTTGDPKGVMLSHHNIISNVHQFNAYFPEMVNRFHKAPSFLPLSHAVERTAVYYCQVYCANKIHFVKSIETLLEDLQTIHPSIMASVPRVLEKMYEAITAKVAQAPPLKQKLFAWALDVGRRNVPFVCKGKARTGLFAIEYALANKLIFSKLKSVLGLDQIYFIGLGGAPMPRKVLEFFLGMDIPCCDAYGLSETSPMVTCNYVGHIQPGTIGVPVIDTEVKISEEGEILVKGPQVMVGYYKNEAATKGAFTPDGFLKTGDLGEFDAEGNLRITGRTKELIITSGGKNISPQNIENSLMFSPYINQLSVVGEGKKFISALIVPAFEVLEPWAKENGVTFADRSELVKHAKVQALFEQQIKAFTKDFGQVEQVKKFTLLDREWLQETGELTPTLKVKRRVIAVKYADAIEKMYS
ncbi:MAG: long-chain fatty acid--CoA ligase [Syntrophales bacterium]|nr:long-chain fatty acid--CoA ligase [Syntrophales bacterium]MDD4338136.1 long-chain fatty acid--CoA ligase [Syntrophales bacterium]HPB69348.1 long-chain fatty acid--CoA ligase [Syntrophales bacterium]HQN25474.1 long-chain fatty acid--CoA ligase [Syntrophales bacterium]HQP28193.1 long-chain fatty acid--CoA ligase [Syntrophales bacterium]